MRHGSRVVLALIILLTFTGAAYGTPKVVLDGKELHFNSAPIVENGRTLVPIEEILQSLNTKIQLYSQNIVTSKGNTVIEMVLEGESYVNGRKVNLDTTAKKIDGKIMLPLRFVCESFDYKVAWDENSQTATLTSISSSSKENNTPREIPSRNLQVDDFSINIPLDWGVMPNILSGLRKSSNVKSCIFAPPIDSNSTLRNYTIFGYIVVIETEVLDKSMTIDQYEKIYESSLKETYPDSIITETNNTELNKTPAKKIVFARMDKEDQTKQTIIYTIAKDKKVFRIIFLEFNDNKLPTDVFNKILNTVDIL